MKYVFKKKLYIVIAFLVDMIGHVIFAPVKLFYRRLPERFNRILLIRLDHIGDVISSMVVLESLRKRFPDSVIDFMAPPSMTDILKENPFINNLVEFEAGWFDEERPSFLKEIINIRKMIKLIKCRHYDLAIDLRGDLCHIIAMFFAGINCRISYGITGGGFLLTHEIPYNGIMHETDRNLALLSVLGVVSHSDLAAQHLPSSGLYLPKKSYEEADSLKEKLHVTGRYAVIHAIPRREEKRWTDDNFAKVVRYLHEKGITSVMAGNISDKAEIRDIIDKSNTPAADIAGGTSLDVLGAVLKNASLFIGVDSGPSHIAAAMGTKAIILFSGVNDPNQWAPKGENIKIIFPGKGRDLSDVNIDEVFEAIDESLRKDKA